MNVTDAEYAAMSWHAKQRFNIRLKTEHSTLIQQLNQAATAIDELDELNTNGRARRPKPLANDAQHIAAALLEMIPPDPAANTHRLELSRELNQIHHPLGRRVRAV